MGAVVVVARTDSRRQRQPSLPISCRASAASEAQWKQLLRASQKPGGVELRRETRNPAVVRPNKKSSSRYCRKQKYSMRYSREPKMLHGVRPKAPSCFARGSLRHSARMTAVLARGTGETNPAVPRHMRPFQPAAPRATDLAPHPLPAPQCSVRFPLCMLLYSAHKKTRFIGFELLFIPTCLKWGQMNYGSNVCPPPPRWWDALI